jgi:hypothetical protein
MSIQEQLSGLESSFHLETVSQLIEHSQKPETTLENLLTHEDSDLQNLDKIPNWLNQDTVSSRMQNLRTKQQPSNQEVVLQKEPTKISTKSGIGRWRPENLVKLEEDKTQSNPLANTKRKLLKLLVDKQN